MNGLKFLYAFVFVSGLFCNISYGQCLVQTGCGALPVSAGFPEGSPTFFCEGEVVEFVNNTDPSLVDITVIDWGDGIVDTFFSELSYEHTYDFPEDTCLMNSIAIPQEITLIVINECGDMMQSVNCITTNVLIQVEPFATFSANSTYCVGEEVCFDNQSCENADDATYQWDIGGLSSSSEENPCFTFTEPGIYPVELAVMNDCGTDFYTHVISVLEGTNAQPPTIQICGETSTFCVDENFFEACVDIVVDPNYCGAIDSFEIRWGDGSITIVDGSFNPADQFHEYDFTDFVGSTNYSIDDIFIQLFTYLENGLVINTVFLPTFVNFPTAVIDDAQTTTCVGEEVCFINGSYPTQNLDLIGWNLLDGTPLPDDGCYTFDTPGEYTVILEVENPCGSDQTTHVISVLEETNAQPPTIQTCGETSTFCVDENFFEACVSIIIDPTMTEPVDSFEISWGDGSTTIVDGSFNPADQFHEYDFTDFVGSANYSIDDIFIQLFTYLENGLVINTVFLPTFVNFPTAVIDDAQTTTCVGEEVCFINGSYPTQNLDLIGWNLLNGTPLPDDGCYTFDTPGEYTVILEVENPCGSDQDTATIIVLDSLVTSPAFEVELSGEACKGEFYDLAYLGGITEDLLFEISSQGNYTIEGGFPGLTRIKWEDEGTHIVELKIITQEGCEWLYEDEVTVSTSPIALLGEDIFTCQPNIILEVDSYEGEIEGWETTGGAIIDEPFSLITNVFELDEGINTFYWRVKSENSNCGTEAVDSIDIIYEFRSLNANDDIYSIKGEVFSVTGNVVENDDLTLEDDWEVRLVDSVEIGSLLLEKNGVFLYQFDATSASQAVFTYELRSISCPEITDTSIVLIELPSITDDIPVGYTPNNDGVNDEFVFSELENNPERYPNNEFVVFNKWGDQVFYAKPYENDWDGTNQSTGKPLPAGTYYYIMKFDFGEAKFRVGQVTIIR